MARLKTWFHGLRSRLLLLVALAVIPAFILIVTANIEARRTATETVQTDMQRLIRLTVGQQQQFIEGGPSVAGRSGNRSRLVSRNRLPVMRQQLSGYAGFQGWQTTEHILQIGIGIMVPESYSVEGLRVPVCKHSQRVQLLPTLH